MTYRGSGVKGFAKGRAFVAKEGEGRNPFEDIPEGSILVSKNISLADSVFVDFKKVVGMVTEEPDADGQVCTLASGLGIPAVSGIEGCTKNIVTGDRLLIRNLDVLVNPDLIEVNEFEELRRNSDCQLSLDI
ncbi:MAG: PEP-utilizing enzyme [Bacteroidales bacterium]|jgi:phosphohistidine swiveling domain-containing protein|nr:PEP-utilizing enzyme [Bacteroidales bacterium]MDY6377726.1 PEP-utilizing enzyme [Bacteroidales bacterium]MDY6384176.1 PEP-utilizing enzyme [Bacteroidales bacterium]